MNNKGERYLAIVFLITILLFGRFCLNENILFFRLLAGVGLGYALTRGYIGFAGSVNRAYNTGSTKLMRTLMFMFFITATASTAVLFGSDAKSFDLWVNPINGGLLIGGILFGFGMAFSACCASGVLTDLVEAFPRAFVTLIFFCAGVYVGFPLQNSQSWIQDSWFSSETGKAIGYNGIYLPDLFKNDGLDGYLGALILTGVFCLIVVIISYAYENKRIREGSYFGVISENNRHLEEKKQIEEYENKNRTFKLFSEETYYKAFIKPWSMKSGAVMISIIFVILMGVTNAGWGASTPYGFWFGKMLMAFGVSPESVAEFAKMKLDPFVMPFFSHPINVQNIGIICGSLLYVLSSEQLKDLIKASVNVSPKQVLFFAIGGFSMGFGTRLSNGCNVGALYTPIANFSLSGWIFLIVLVIGGIIGNKFAKMMKL